MTKTIGIDGRKYRDLNQGSTIAAYSMQPVRGLAQPESIPHIAATMPQAPAGYAWAHLAEPARRIGRTE